jgi:radical SAM superfamily enzyme YgiQ (UPF0313 family)
VRAWEKGYGSLRNDKWAILVNPPVYDTQYWARWAMPHGLLKIASWLKQNGYETVLFDCLNPYGFRSGVGETPPEEGYDTVRKTKRWVIKCATGENDPEWLRDIPPNYKLQTNEKFRFIYGMPVEELEQQFETFRQLRLADGDYRPVELWVTSVMTYWWESTRDVVAAAQRVFGDIRVRLGGIYPTLASWHAEKKLGLSRPLTIEGNGMRLDDPDQMSHDLIVRREIDEASWLPLDLSLYSDAERPPYTILTTSRGCPHTCSYCAAHVLNNSGRRVVSMKQELVIQEIRDKLALGVRHFCFYEDNLLMNIRDFKDLLKRIIEDNSLAGIKLYAPEGIEIAIALNDTKRWLLKSSAGDIGTFWIEQPVARPRAENGDLLITLEPDLEGRRAIARERVPNGVVVEEESDGPGTMAVQIGGDRLLLRIEGQEIVWVNAGQTKRQYQWTAVPEVLYLMKKAGFDKIYLPLETVKARTNKRWNRAWNRLPNFERLLDALIAVGYSPRKQDINAFVMFGLPGEDIEEVMDTALYASARVGSVIPMLFTPVPSTPAFEDYKPFIEEHHYDLQHLNGKLYPFFDQLKEINDARGRTPLTLRDYIRLEAFMQRLNAKVMGRSFDILDEDSRVASIFRKVFTERSLAEREGQAASFLDEGTETLNNDEP